MNKRIYTSGIYVLVNYENLITFEELINNYPVFAKCTCWQDVIKHFPGNCYNPVPLQKRCKCIDGGYNMLCVVKMNGVFGKGDL